MSYDSAPQPATQNQQPLDAQAERDYRDQLIGQITQESIGSLGLYMTADFQPDEKRVLQSAINDRSARAGNTSPRVPNGGGWANYGERTICTFNSDDPLAKDMAKMLEGSPSEGLLFTELPDNTIDVRYGFTSKYMIDDTGRPGNKITMGFKVSKETAGELFTAVQKDPTVIREVTKAQAMAMGINTRRWTMNMSPRYEQFGAPDVYPESAALQLGILRDGSLKNTETVPFSRRESVLPEQPVVTSSQTSATEAVEKEGSGFTFADAKSMASEFLEAYKSNDPQIVLRDLAELAVVASNSQAEAAVSGNKRGMIDEMFKQEAYRQTYAEHFMNRLAEGDDFQNLAYSCLHHALVYFANDFPPGTEVKSPYTVDRDDPRFKSELGVFKFTSDYLASQGLVVSRADSDKMLHDIVTKSRR